MLDAFDPIQVWAQVVSCYNIRRAKNAELAGGASVNVEAKRPLNTEAEAYGTGTMRLQQDHRTFCWSNL